MKSECCRNAIVCGKVCEKTAKGRKLPQAVVCEKPAKGCPRKLQKGPEVSEAPRSALNEAPLAENLHAYV